MSVTYTPIGATDQVDDTVINDLGQLILDVWLLSSRVTDTIDTLRGLAGTELAGACMVLGAAAKGDGGGGLFWWDSASTEADDAATIIIPNGGGTGRWKLLEDANTTAIAAIVADINELQAGQGHDDSYPARVYNLTEDATGSDTSHAFGVSPTFTADAPSNELTVATHGLTTGDHVMVESAGVLPAGLAEFTDYFVRAVDASTLTLHPTPADAAANTNVVDITDAGSGLHYLGWTFNHHTPVDYYGQGHASGTPIMKVTASTAKIYFWAALLGHTGLMTVYMRKSATGPYVPLMSRSATGDISGRRTLTGMLVTEAFEFYVAPCSGSGVFTASKTLSFELDITARNL